MIERVPPPAEIAGKVNGTPKAELPGLYAEAGLWYDALAAVSDPPQCQFFLTLRIP